MELNHCPFCVKNVALCDTVAEILFTDSDDPDYEWNSSHYAVVCDFRAGCCGSMTGCNNETPEDAAAAWNRRSK